MSLIQAKNNAPPGPAMTFHIWIAAFVSSLLIGRPRDIIRQHKNNDCVHPRSIYKKVLISATNCLANGDRAVEALTLSDVKVDLDVPASGGRSIEGAEVLLADLRALALSVVVGVDVLSSVSRAEAGGDIDPALVVVNTKGDNEVLVGVFEAEEAGGTAAAHGEDLLPVDFGPAATVTEVPDRLFDDLEPGVGVGLVDTASDGVRHGSYCKRSEFGGRTAMEGVCSLGLLGVLASKTGCLYAWVLWSFVPLI